MSLTWIILVLHATFGIAALVLGNFVFVESQWQGLYMGAGLALLVALGVHMALIAYDKSRKLTDKDRVRKIGAIEKKAEIRALARAKAGYQTVKLGSYLLGMTLLTMFFSGLYPEVLRVLAGVALIGALIFGLFYLADAAKISKESK